MVKKKKKGSVLSNFALLVIIALFIKIFFLGNDNTELKREQKKTISPNVV